MQKTAQTNLQKMMKDAQAKVEQEKKKKEAVKAQLVPLDPKAVLLPQSTNKIQPNQARDNTQQTKDSVSKAFAEAIKKSGGDRKFIDSLAN